MYSQNAENSSTEGFFKRLFQKARIDNPFIDKFNFNQDINQLSLLKVLWITFLVMSYIFCKHNLESLTRKLEKADLAVKEMRASYISYKSRYMFKSKHSEVSRKLGAIGMDKNIEPPIKIVIEE